MRSRFKVTLVVDVSGTKEEVQTALHHGIWNILDNASFITGKKELLESIEVTHVESYEEKSKPTNTGKEGETGTSEGASESNQGSNGPERIL